MNPFNKIAIKLFFTVSIFNLTMSCNKISTNKNIDDVYQSLEIGLDSRKTSLINYLNETKKLARQIQNDNNMIDFFEVERELSSFKQQGNLPQVLAAQNKQLNDNIQHYYLMNYQSFYDILFVDITGEIFYTIRKQTDYEKNIFEGELANTGLSKKLKNIPNESFVDFQFYEVSGEPSAFFIEPLIKGDSAIGWFVMQCTINKINNIFELNKTLGSTGEVVLVNKDHYMLTNSRFNVESTILKQQLPQENIESKFRERKGKKTVIDYRGKEVLSVFDVFDFFGSEWLIIAKIDKNEVDTKHYLKNRENLLPVLKKSLSELKIKVHKEIEHRQSVINVDMDEYQRADTSNSISTQGVSSCTALTITYPGRFSYLAHVSPYDIIYNDTRTDILGQLFKQISFFDITESEKYKLEFLVMSTQLNSLDKLIEKITDEGFFLSQIKFAFNTNAVYGNIYSDCSTNQNIVTWKLKQGQNEYLIQNFNDIPSLEMLIREYTIY